MLLRESEERYRLLADNTDDFISLEDVAGNHLYISPSYYRITGWTPEDLAATHWRERMHRDDLPAIERAKQAVVTGEQQVLEHRIRCRNGAWIWVSQHLKPIIGADGKTQQVLLWANIITARKHAEEALRTSEERLKLAQASAGAGMWDWDMASGALDWSVELFQLFGMDPQVAHATFDTWRSVVHPQDVTMAGQCIEAAIRDRAPLASEYRLVLPSGEVRWISALGNTTYDGSGKPVRMSGICLDITARKQAEEALRMHMQELRELNDELTRFNRAAVGRELRLIELKTEINAHLAAAGQPPRYKVEFDEN